MIDLQKKLTELEMLVAHQDKQIGELSEMTSDQWQEIDTLKHQVHLLVKRVKEFEFAASDEKTSDAMTISEMAAAEKPPHY